MFKRTRGAIAAMLGAVLLMGCAALSAVGITPANAPLLAAVAGEMRAGANVIRANARGDTVAVRLSCFRIRQLRAGFNGTVGLQLSADVNAALAESRRLTDDVCTEAGVPAVGPVTVTLPDDPQLAPPPS
jgi:hypothetical protein